MTTASSADAGMAGMAGIAGIAGSTGSTGSAGKRFAGERHSTTISLNVLYASGVANHFLYLLSEGSGAKDINGVHYDSPTVDGSTVTGIGRDKAVEIWYKALTAYFTSTTDLYGAGSAVDAAWAGVNVKA